MSGVQRRLTQAQLNRIAACVNHDLQTDESEFHDEHERAAEALGIIADAFGLDVEQALQQF